MSNSTDVLTPAGEFRWDYLQGMDLRYPSQADFSKMHVYKNGEVLLKEGDFAALRALCVSKGLASPTDRSPGSSVSVLQSAGYLVEAVVDVDAFHASRNAYSTECARREAEFKRALFEREGLVDHPKAEACYAKAYERAHAQGLAEVANVFIDLAELIR